jgi:DNA-binding beta-propeller fold protein YncE
MPGVVKRKPAVVGLLAALLLLDLALGLAVIHAKFFSSLSLGEFLWTAWDAVSLWAGRFVTIAGVLTPVAVFITKNRWPRKQSWQQSFSALWRRLSILPDRVWVSAPAFAILIGVAFVLGAQLWIDKPAYAASPSPIFIAAGGSELYVITDESRAAGKIVRLDLSTGKRRLGVIDVGGTPDRMLRGPRSGDTYVLDVQRAIVTVLKPDGSVRNIFASRGKLATSIALTPDERKLFISNQQPSPLATLTVVDLSKKEHPVASIPGFNCPMGLGILPDGSKLYAASQCGGGFDPVFVVNTHSDTIAKRIPGFAVGGEVAVGLDRVFIGRGGPSRISTIDPARDVSVPSEELAKGGNALTVSSDGKYLFYSTSNTIEVVNVKTYKSLSVPTGYMATGIAIGADRRGDEGNLSLYALLPERKDPVSGEKEPVFFTGLSGLLP